jgi:hypothetical protein
MHYLKENVSMTTFSYSIAGPALRSPVGETVGVAVTESMDVRIMQNAPYGGNQQ